MHHVLELLEKWSFCKYKGYMCNYDFIQGPFYSYIWIGCGIIAFVEGVFAKFSAFIAWQQNLLLNVSLKWICIEKDKIPRIQNLSYVFKIISWIFDQRNFLHNIKVVYIEKLNNFNVGHFFIWALV